MSEPAYNCGTPAKLAAIIKTLHLLVFKNATIGWQLKMVVLVWQLSASINGWVVAVGGQIITL